MRSARHLTIMQKCSDSHTRSYFKTSWHALNSLAAPQRRDGEKNATPSSQGNRPLSQPGRGVKWVAGGNAPGKRALPTLCPSPRPCGERGDPLWRVDRGFHPRLPMLLPCGERPTLGLLIPTRRSTRSPERA